MAEKTLLLILLLLLLGGCMIGPDYRRPPVETPAGWRLAETEARETANTRWWEQFGDPVLNDLIGTAIRENKDLKIAAARVEEFIGRYGATRSPLFPQVGVDAAAGRERFTEEGPTPLPPGVGSTHDFYEARLFATWELDIWGRIRRATEGARADILASEEGRRSVVLTVVSGVAAAYLTLRDLDLQLAIARRTVDSRRGSYELFQERYEGGVISELELSQTKSQYEEALATIPDFERRIVQVENALSVLLGRNPGPIPRGRPLEELAVPAVPAGLPSDLLVRRPDIIEAEQTLVAANARIGVARAAYFPAISLTGFLGTSSADLSDLFSGGSKVWGIAAPLTTPIFTAGGIRGNVAAAEAIRQQALFGYQKTIQTAFREVEDALVDQNRTREQLAVLGRQVASLRDYAGLARLRFDEGITSYVEVLDAERTLFNAELAQAQTRENLLQALVNLYKAMGGGWIAEADKEQASLSGEARR